MNMPGPFISEDGRSAGWSGVKRSPFQPKGTLSSWWFRIIFLAAFSSFFLNFVHTIAEYAFRHDYAPWGFLYDHIRGDEELKGRIGYINPEKVAETLGEQLSGSAAEDGFIIFRTRLFVFADSTFSLHLSPPAQTKIFVDGQPVKTVRRNNNFYVDISFSGGWHDLTIQYFITESAPEKVRFVLMDRGIMAVPFYNYTLPGDRTSLLLSNYLRQVARFRHTGYFIGFMLLLYPLVMSIGRSPRDIYPVAKRSLLFVLAEICGFSLSLLLVVHFINGHFVMELTLKSMLLIVTTITVFFSVVIIRTGVFHRKVSLEAILVMLISAGWVFWYVYQKSSMLFPLELVGTGDVLTHLCMIDYIREYGHFYKGGWGPIYPQALHGLLALICDASDLESRQVITIFLIGVMTILLVTLFYLARSFIHSLGVGSFFLVIAVSNLTFIQYTMFELYSFPAIVAVLFFLASLFFLLNERYVSSTLLLTAALLSYPYFAAVFCLVLFIFLLLSWVEKETKPGMKALWTGLYFFLPALYMFIYVVTFFKTGYAQHEQGFDPPYKLVPFDFLTNVNVLFILIGLCLCVWRRISKELLFLALAVITGFLLYYIPYRFFSVLTAYYLMKNMHYLILIGVVFEMVGLTALADRFARSRGMGRLFTSLAVFFAFFIYWLSLK